MEHLSAGDTAWVLASAALVMLMTPALGFFYGGLVRQKNVLSTLMHLSKPAELADGWERASSVFTPNPAEPKNGRFKVPTAPGLGYVFDESEMARRQIALA